MMMFLSQVKLKLKSLNLTGDHHFLLQTVYGSEQNQVINIRVIWDHNLRLWVAQTLEDNVIKLRSGIVQASQSWISDIVLYHYCNTLISMDSWPLSLHFLNDQNDQGLQKSGYYSIDPPCVEDANTKRIFNNINILNQVMKICCNIQLVQKIFQEGFCGIYLIFVWRITTLICWNNRHEQCG